MTPYPDQDQVSLCAEDGEGKRKATDHATHLDNGVIRSHICTFAEALQEPKRADIARTYQQLLEYKRANVMAVG